MNRHQYKPNCQRHLPASQAPINPQHPTNTTIQAAEGQTVGVQLPLQGGYALIPRYTLESLRQMVAQKNTLDADELGPTFFHETKQTFQLIYGFTVFQDYEAALKSENRIAIHTVDEHGNHLGSRHYVKVDAAYIHNENIELPSQQVTAADFGLSGKTVHSRVTAPKVRFSDLTFKNVKINVIGNTDGDGDDWWVVGSALLSQFKTVIDYHSSKIHIIPYEDSIYESSYNLLGLELRKLNNGHFIVRYVFPQMPSQAFDLKVGDMITKIDGIQAKEISLENWLSITNEAGPHSICRVREQEECFTIVSKEIKGYSDF